MSLSHITHVLIPCQSHLCHLIPISYYSHIYYNFLTDNNLLCNSQSGFRCLHSTVTALLESTNNWAYNIDQGRVNAVVFLDLKKAFDTVNHGILYQN